MKYSPLVLCGIFCSFFALLLSVIPKECFQISEGAKMKQALGLINKDSHLHPSTTGGTGTTTAATGRSSALDQIRAERRIRNALLVNQNTT